MPFVYVFVDGIGDVGQEILRDRRRLADDGVLIVTITLDSHTGELLDDPTQVMLVPNAEIAASKTASTTDNGDGMLEYTGK